MSDVTIRGAQVSGGALYVYDTSGTGADSVDDLLVSANTLQGSTNSILGVNRGSTVTRIASTNAILVINRNSVTDLQASANTLIALNRTSNTSQMAILRGSINSHIYKSNVRWYSAATATATSYKVFHFGGTAHSMALQLTSGSAVACLFSFDGGTTQHGKLFVGSTLVMDGNPASTIAVKAAAAGTVRPEIHVWG